MLVNDKRYSHTLFLRHEYVKFELLRMRGDEIPAETQRYRDEYIEYWDKKLETLTVNAGNMRNRYTPQRRTYIPSSLKRLAGVYTSMKKTNGTITDDMHEGYNEYAALHQNRTLRDAFRRSRARSNVAEITLDEETIRTLRAANEEYDRRMRANEIIDDNLVWAKNKYMQWCFRE